MPHPRHKADPGTGDRGAGARLDTASEAAGELRRGAACLGLALEDRRQAALLAYLGLLVRWNRAYKLTSISEPLDLVRRHLLDALAIAPLVRGPRVLDVGSGAGVPGLVLAIAMPELSLTLLDPALKRTRFLIQAVHDLPVPNARVVRARLESEGLGGGFDTVVSRASLPLAALVRGAGGLLAPGGQILAMLGQARDGERTQLPDQFSLRLEPLRVPGLDAARHVAVVWPRPS